MQWSERQTKAITEYGKNILVSAAAGSGKTAVLIERIYRLITERHISLENMLVVTFTKAAASEMKERLRGSLAKEIAASTDPAKTKLLKEQQRALSRADICTFDSFVQKIVRNYYQIIGLNPGLKIADGYKAELLKKESLDELFKHKYQTADADFIYYLDRYASVNSDEAVRSQIVDLYDYVITLPDPNSLLDAPMFSAEGLYQYALQMARIRASKSLDGIKTLKDFLLVNEMPILASKLDSSMLAIEGIIALLENGKLEDALAKIQTCPFETLAASGAEKEKKKACDDEIKNLWAECKDQLRKIASDYPNLSLATLQKEEELLSEPVRIIAALTKEFMEIFQAKKTKAGLMDFSDGEHFAIEILKNPEVQKQLQDKYTCIFVDEYQDSNPVQEAIIQAVSSGDNVFTVGDVKQSIYKFRHAEPEMFIDKYDLYKHDPSKGQVIDLNSNYRSKAPVIDFVNDVFKGLMDKDSCGIVYDDDAALKEGAPYQGAHTYKPEFILINTENQDDDTFIEALKNEEIEAAEAIRLIQTYADGTHYINDRGVDRPLCYGDIAILMKSTSSNGEIFYSKLSKAGIPVYLERSEGFFNTPEIAVFTNLMKVIANFNQDIPLLSVLHCPAFGFATKELAEVRIFAKEHEKFNYSYSQAFTYYAKNAEGELSVKCQTFIERIKAWKLASQALSLPDFLWNLLSESGIDIFAMSLSSGNQRMANLRAICDKAMTFEQDGQGGLAGFTSLIESLAESGNKIKTGQAMVGAGDDCVKIMTIHKSKGLEFPMVILAGASKDLYRNSQDSSYVFHKDFGVAMEYVNPKQMLSYEPLSLKLIKYAKKREERAESLRVLYVAITRAKDIFITLGSDKFVNKFLLSRLCYKFKKEDCNSFYKMMLPVIPSVNVIYKDKLDPEEPEELRETKLRLLLDRGFAIDETKLAMRKEEIEENLNFDYSSSAPLGKKKYSVSELAKEMLEKDGEETFAEDTFITPNFLSGARKLSAAEIGTAYHKVMEHLDFKNGDKSEAAIRAFIETLVSRDILRKEEAGSIDASNIAKFFESELGTLIAKADEVHKESSFVLKKDYEGKEILLQGTIDCWFKLGGKLFLCDYKSNYISPKDIETGAANLTKKYAPQLSLYKEALEQITGEKVEKSYLYLFSAGFNIELK